MHEPPEDPPDDPPPPEEAGVLVLAGSAGAEELAAGSGAAEVAAGAAEEVVSEPEPESPPESPELPAVLPSPANLAVPVQPLVLAKFAALPPFVQLEPGLGNTTSTLSLVMHPLMLATNIGGKLARFASDLVEFVASSSVERCSNPW